FQVRFITLPARLARHAVWLMRRRRWLYSKQLLSVPGMSGDGKTGGGMNQEKTQRDRILLVDDEPNILATTQVILEVEGYQVATASSGEEALELIKTTSYDLLIVD